MSKKNKKIKATKTLGPRIAPSSRFANIGIPKRASITVKRHTRKAHPRRTSGGTTIVKPTIVSKYTRQGSLSIPKKKRFKPQPTFKPTERYSSKKKKSYQYSQILPTIQDLINENSNIFMTDIDALKNILSYDLSEIVDYNYDKSGDYTFILRDGSVVTPDEIRAVYKKMYRTDRRLQKKEIGYALADEGYDPKEVYFDNSEMLREIQTNKILYRTEDDIEKVISTIRKDKMMLQIEELGREIKEEQIYSHFYH